MSNRRAHGEGSIYYEDTRERWVGVYDLGIDPATGRRRRRKVTGESRKVVAERLASLRADTKAGINVGAPPTVADLYGPWIDRKAERVVASTAKMSRDLWTVHVGPVFATRPVDQVTVAEIETFLTARRHLAAATLRKIRGLLAQVIDQAVRHRVVNYNAARLAEIPAGAKPSMASRSLTVDEAVALLATARGERLEPWLIVALHTGARPGEISALEWEDIDLDAGTLQIAATKPGRISP